MKHWLKTLFPQIFGVFLLVGFSTVLTWFFTPKTTVIRGKNEINNVDVSFNEMRAYQDVVLQTNLGPRVPGSIAHQEMSDWIRNELIEYNWIVETQEGQVNGYPVKNIIGQKGGGYPWTILGAHYDTRIYADKDPEMENRRQPVPGANDGASGVAVLLELGRVLSQSGNTGTTWLVFFDAEDNGNIENREWVMGSQYFVDTLNELPDRVVILDMVGDQDLGIYQEKNSDAQLSQEIWDTAIQLGYENYFFTELKYRIIDDHLPFIEKGIPAVDIIDFDYPYWHTTLDTVDKVSPESLKIVGDTIFTWLKNNP